MTPAGEEPLRLPIRSDADLVAVRQCVREAATGAGFSLVSQTKLVTATSELARNTLLHGGGGHVEMTVIHAAGNTGLRLRFADEGPGIEDAEQALTDGYTSGTGLGLGLGGSRRLVDEFDLASAPGQGTVVTVTSWAVPPVVPAGPSGARTIGGGTREVSE